MSQVQSLRTFSRLKDEDLRKDQSILFDGYLRVEVRSTYVSVWTMNSVHPDTPVYWDEDTKDPESVDDPNDGDYQD
jgi:hypothetical protein